MGKVSRFGKENPVEWEQIKLDRCGKILHLMDIDDGEDVAGMVHTCKSKFCDECGKAKAAKAVTRILHMIKAVIGNSVNRLKLLRFVTLTSLPLEPGENIQGRCQKLRESFRLVMRRFKIVGAITALEITVRPDGSLHIHMHAISLGPFISHDQLSRYWEELTGAHIVDVRKIWSVHKAIQYVVKGILCETLKQETDNAELRKERSGNIPIGAAWKEYGPAWQEWILKGLRNCRMVSCRGCFYQSGVKEEIGIKRRKDGQRVHVKHLGLIQLEIGSDERAKQGEKKIWDLFGIKKKIKDLLTEYHIIRYVIDVNFGKHPPGGWDLWFEMAEIEDQELREDWELMKSGRFFSV